MLLQEHFKCENSRLQLFRVALCFRPKQKNFNPPEKNKGTSKKLFLNIKCHMFPPRLSTLPLSGDFELVAFFLYYMYLYIYVLVGLRLKEKVNQWQRIGLACSSPSSNPLPPALSQNLSASRWAATWDGSGSSADLRLVAEVQKCRKTYRYMRGKNK